MKLLIINNYDSFTYNLVHLVEKILHERVSVAFNDCIALEEIDKFDKIIVSPGPGLPSEAGITIPLIHRYAATKPILGVCLGHQAIAEAFGGRLNNYKEVFHGVGTRINVVPGSHYIFEGLPPQFVVGRYHSWYVSNHDLPRQLIPTAFDENGGIMALAHKDLPLTGVQFHPESILTEHGEQILQNWLLH